MVSIKRALFVDEAIHLVLEHTQPLETRLALLSDCDGEILAEDIAAKMDVPHFDRSMMDGYAICSEDVVQASLSQPVSLQVVDSVMAGQVSRHVLQPGEAIRIMTGAAIPAGADAVCRFEKTKEGFSADIGRVEILTPIQTGESIAIQGEDIKQGTVILRKGTPIGPAEASILATVGYAEVSVFQQPKVAIIPTGSELVAVEDEILPHGKIRNSNGFMISQIVRGQGGVPHLFSVVSDDPVLLKQQLKTAAADADIIVFTGGVSVGDHDYIPAILSESGVDLIFRKVLIRPGQPILLGKLGKKIILGLSGNPAACFVNAMLFLVPAVRRMNGRTKEMSMLPTIKGVLVGEIRKLPIKHTRFLRATAYSNDGKIYADVRKAQSSAIMSSFLGTNCFVRIDADCYPAEGDLVDILLYDSNLQRVNSIG